MTNERQEELAALQGIDFLDATAQTELLRAAGQDPQIALLVREYAEVAAALAYDAPQVRPPAELKNAVMDQLSSDAGNTKIVSFFSWVPYAIAACLMLLGISQARQILDLKSRLAAEGVELVRLNQSNALLGLRLATLEAKDPAYVSAKVLVAWDTLQHHGVVAIQNLPPPTAGHDYQLWVLDPEAAAPISAGVIKPQAGSRPFGVGAVHTTSPGFAISLEPGGGSPAPTGAILFAVAPGQ